MDCSIKKNLFGRVLVHIYAAFLKKYNFGTCALTFEQHCKIENVRERLSNVDDKIKVEGKMEKKFEGITLMFGKLKLKLDIIRPGVFELVEKRSATIYLLLSNL